MTPDPRIADAIKIRDELHKIGSSPQSLVGQADASLTFLLSDRERAIDEAVKGERERAAKIAEAVECETHPDWPASYVDSYESGVEDAGDKIASTIRRPPDTESGG